MLKTDEFSYKNFTLWHINMKKRGKDGKNTLHVYILLHMNLSSSLLSGSFHFPFFVFWSKWQKTKKISCPTCLFSVKKITFCLKITADFFVFWSLWPKNEKWNELDIKSLENFITQGEFSQTINHFSRFCGMALNGFLLHSLVLFMSLLFCSSLFFTEFVLIFSK